jgi:hypothetical protein
MNELIKLNYKGWFGVCPVYFDDPNKEAPLILERHILLAPLFIFSEAMFGFVFWCLQAMGAENPGWPLKVTAKLDPPKLYDREADEVIG